MIELLLVVVIAGLIAGLAVPRFVQSYKGGRLRDSVRTVIRMHRYARSTSVLNQQQGALLFDIEKSTITLVAVPNEEKSIRDSGFLDAMKTQDSIFSNGVDEDAVEADGSGKKEIEEKLERTLAKGVEIVEFRSDVADQEIEGIYWVNYFANGMCNPYEVRIKGPDGNNFARVEVDSVSGQVEAEYE